MSQIYKKITDGDLPPDVPTSFVEDSGTATPAAHILNIIGGFISNDFNNGIRTTGNLSNTVSILLTNRLFGQTATSGAVTGDVVTFPLQATAKVYTFDLKISGRDTVANNGYGYNIFGTIKSDGAVATLVGTPDKIVNEDNSAADCVLTVSGNSAVIRVTGVAGQTISWACVGYYTTV